ncbi:MAG: hypothetical protein IT518_11905 [Burkholderiales bacterium]|nr:hypothetical protein [Burkholderiales bacterium]
MGAPLPERDAAAIRAWLDAIDETDPEAGGAVLRQYHEDADARAWYLNQARPYLPTYGLMTDLPIALREPDDDRRRCDECGNLTTTPRGPRCRAAARGERPNGVATRDYLPMLGMLGRCASFVALLGDPDQRTAAERWPLFVEDAKRGLEAARNGY